MYGIYFFPRSLLCYQMIILKLIKVNLITFLYHQVEMQDFNISAVDKLLNGLKNTVSSVRKSFERIYNRGDYIPLISVNNRKLEKKLKTYNYIDLEKFKIYRPMGLEANYFDLLNVIEEIQVDLLTIEERVLVPFLKWSGEVLNRPEKLSRVTINRELRFMDVPLCNKRLDGLFNKDDTGDVYEYSKAFQSNGQVMEVIKEANRLINEQNKLPPKELLKKTSGVYDRADVLVRRCKTISDDSLCSRESKKVMSDVFFDIGEEMSLYGRLSYNLMSTQVALTDTAEKILKMS